MCILRYKHPWYGYEDKNKALQKELMSELPNDHVLKGIKCKVIGRREDCDDILVKINDDKYAIVHLTWTSKKEINPYPFTKFFDLEGINNEIKIESLYHFVEQ